MSFTLTCVCQCELDYFRRKDSIDSKEIVSLVFVMGVNNKDQEVVGQAYLQMGTSRRL